jgi:hypothetical protein
MSTDDAAEDYSAGGFVSGVAIVRTLRPIRVYSPEEIAAFARYLPKKVNR